MKVAIAIMRNVGQATLSGFVMPQHIYSGPSIDIVKSLSPEAFRVIPLAAAPSGVVPDFENPSTRVPVILGVSIASLVSATLCLGIRVHTKLYIMKKWKWDDRCRDGPLGRHEWEVHLDKAFSHGNLVSDIVCQLMTNPALGLIKMGESLLDLVLSWHYLEFGKTSIPGGVVGMLKLRTMLVFVTGALGVGASMMSLYYRVLLQNNPDDVTWKVGYTLLWTQVEMWAGATASCMPSVKQLFSRYMPSLSQSSAFKPSLLSFRRSTKDGVPDAERGFRRWGYKSNAVTESTTRIGNRFEDTETEKVNSRSTFSQRSRP
ncbi:hypothetical protein P171DRAFT_483919 [Karstenula rhodostoma CBS 690.94]|uniref:Rhodopsin domain-containing protein n=1 Tax=Karstenula rhodostoma CBS 690.94 TaxID=1392251 RepID=A0A9P4UDX0_9PLEO|nr:hypothetical protein P171DRAFT_483919 [Karstenula rhodostoma CBS 690.94]